MGMEFSNQKIRTLYPYLLRNRRGYDSLRAYNLDYQTFPALLFDPHPSQFEFPKDTGRSQFILPDSVKMPKDLEQIAFFTIPELAYLLRKQKITSVELTQMYLNRIRKHDSILHAVITLTEDLALKQAKKADVEIQQGKFRSLLHGIPYGVKDLIAVEGYPTTWGAVPYQTQQLDHTATLVQKLEKAGAVLIAKLSSGALARGDVWFAHQTRNPWDTLQGASGSSAGSGSGTAAGLVGFSIGTETLGSITSPSTRNGISGLRPTYGRVSRNGVMSLSWSMDKVGPMCRSAEGCAIIFDIISGKDSLDQTTSSLPFVYTENKHISELKVGYLKDLVDADTTQSGDQLRRAIEIIQAEGIELLPLSLPDSFPFAAFDIILRSEAGAFFEELIRSEDIDKMVQQDERSRANSLRQSRFIPAVEYLQANRFRRILIEDMHKVMKDIDVLISPTFGGRQLMITNLTGHPVVCVPTGLDALNHPTSISFLGNLYDEATILFFAKRFQQLTDHHKKYPLDFYP